MDYTLQTEAKVLAAQSRALRKQELSLRNKRRKSKSLDNMDHLGMERKATYKQRMYCRENSRYLHLIRAYINGLPYKSVEQSVKPGNTVSLDSLEFYRNHYGYSGIIFMPQFIEWLKGC